MNIISQLMCFFLKIFVYLFEDLDFKTPQQLCSHSIAFVLPGPYCLLRAASNAKAPLGPTFPSLTEHDHFKAT